MKPIVYCKFCGISGLKMAESHLIPKALCLDLRGNSGPIVQLIEDGPNKKSQTGEVDREILCLDCEAKFTDYDDYGIKFIRKKDWSDLIFDPDSKQDYHLIKNYDYRKLKLFLIGFLLRCSYSQRSGYTNINLGMYESVAKKAIDSGRAEEAECFQIIFFKYKKSKLVPKLEETHLTPYINNIASCRTYMFDFSGFKFCVRVGKSKLASEDAKFFLRENEPYRLYYLPYDGTGTFKALIGRI